MMRRMSGGVLGAMLALSMTAEGQDAAQRLERVRDGNVRFTFTLKPGVCGQGHNVWTTGRSGRNVWLDKRGAADVEYDVECDAGPGRVIVEKASGSVQDVRFYVGGRWKASSQVTDLGSLGSREAASILLDLVRTAEGKPADQAIFPLTLVDSAQPWSDLLRVARDNARPSRVRKQAVFWLGQGAGDKATEGLAELVGEDALDRDVREQAIFALSQQPKDQGIPALIRVVRTHRDPELRRKALFWLGQSGDPRAVDLIEELLVKR